MVSKALAQEEQKNLPKPINVEAQRIEKILQETQANLKSLSFLSSELFQEISNKNNAEEEVKGSFGPEIGQLLLNEAQCEVDFESKNCCHDTVHMEPVDSDNFENAMQRNEAIRNANCIRSNILKLVRIFRRDDMQSKLNKDYRDVKPQNSEIDKYNGIFEKVVGLWFTKLGTSLEDHTRMQEQVELSSKRVKDLSEQLKSKKEQLEKFAKQSKEHKENRRQEIENLKKAKNELKSEKYNTESKLQNEADEKKKQAQRMHEERMRDLESNLNDLQTQLEQAKKENGAAEKVLLGQFESQDKQYTDALDSYDQEMREKNKERDDNQAELKDQEHHLAQIRDTWAERVEEKRKRNALQKIMDEKKEKQQKEMKTLHEASRFLQAHYRGMLARRDMDRARKGKKGKRRKK